MKESRLYEVWLVSILYRDHLLSDRGGYRVYTDGASPESFYNHAKYLSVQMLEPHVIDFKSIESFLRHIEIYPSAAQDL